MAQYSKGVRETIIQLHLNGHKPNSIKLLINENIAISTICRLIRKYAITKSVTNNKRKGKRKVSKVILDFIEDFCDRNRWVCV